MKSVDSSCRIPALSAYWTGMWASALVKASAYTQAPVNLSRRSFSVGGNLTQKRAMRLK